MTRNPCWYKILFLFLRRFQKWKQNRKKLQRVERGLFFFSFFFFIYTVEERDKLEMDTVEHTASTILVVQMVTKERTLSIPYWSFGCLQATWISVGAVLFFCFIFFFVPTWDGWGLQVRFCHKDIEWCGGVFVYFGSLFLRKSGRHHNNMDRIL